MICELRNNLKVTAEDGDKSITLAATGKIVNVSHIDPSQPASPETTPVATPTSFQKDGYEVSDQPIPGNLFSGMNVGFNPGEGNIGMDYLCRCEELKRYADAVGLPMVAQAPPEPTLPGAILATPDLAVAPPPQGVIVKSGVQGLNQAAA